MNEWAKMFVTMLGAMLASTGFWSYLQRRYDTKDIQCKLLVGLAHDRIMYLALKYIEKEYITKDEYENLVDYLYRPYIEMKGNGAVQRVVEEVKKLPIYKDPPGLGLVNERGD